MRTEALKQLGLWGKVPQRDRVVGIYRPMKERPAADAVARVVAGRFEVVSRRRARAGATGDARSRAIPGAAQRCAGAGGDGEQPEGIRAGAHRRAQGAGRHGRRTRCSRRWRRRRNPSVPALRLAALQIVAHRAPERALPVIKRFAASKSEVEQQAAFQAMAELDSPQARGLAGRARSISSPLAKCCPVPQVELLETVQKSTAPAVKARWEKQQAAWAASSDPLAAVSLMRSRAAIPGAATSSSTENQILPCARCHKVGGEGGEAGPDLSRIGAQHPARVPAGIRGEAQRTHRAGLRQRDVHDGERRDRDRQPGQRVRDADRAQARRRHPGDARSEAGEATRGGAVVDARDLRPGADARSQLRDIVAFLRRLDGSRGPSAPEESFGASNRAMQSVPKEGTAGGHP